MFPILNERVAAAVVYEDLLRKNMRLSINNFHGQEHKALIEFIKSFEALYPDVKGDIRPPLE